MGVIGGKLTVRGEGAERFQFGKRKGRRVGPVILYGGGGVIKMDGTEGPKKNTR